MTSRARIPSPPIFARMSPISPWLRRPTVRTIASFLLVLVLYGVYATCAVPWIEPPQSAVAHVHDSPPPPLKLPPRYQALFQQNTWEQSARFSLQTRDALVLAHDLEQMGPHQVRIAPCTLIWDTSSKDRDSTIIVLQAQEGAELTFDKDSDLQIGKVGQIETANLRGPVHIQRLQPGDPLPEVDVKSSNVHMDTTRIWTADQVDFRWRGSQGRGRGMVINLHDPRLLAEEPSDAPAISRVKSLEVDQLDELHIELPPKQTEPPVAAVRPHWLDVRCRGRMWVDFDQRVATLDRDVTIFHHGEQEQAEQLSCDTLSLYFEPASPRPQDSLVPEGTAVAAQSSQIPKMTLRQLVAVGHPVIADMPAEKAWARCDRLVYFPEQNQVLLESQSASPVEVKHGDKHLRFPRRLEYSWLLSGTRPRSLHIEGPGEYHGPLTIPATTNSTGPPADQRELVATWSSGLTLTRQEARLRVTLNADAAAGSQVAPVVILGHTLGELQAEQVQMELEERAGASAASPGLGAGAPAPGGRSRSMAGIVPIGFSTRGRTTLQSPQLDLQCSALDGDFLGAAPQPSLAAAVGAPHASEIPRTSTPSSGPTLGPAQDRLPLPVPRGATTPPDRWKVQGHTVHLQLEQTVPGRWAPGSVNLEGAVDVQRWSQDPKQQPLEFRGEQLTMHHPNAPDGFVHLVGRPARVDWGQTTLQAEQAHLQSGSGEINIPGPGAVWLPANPQSSMLSEPVEVTWGGNMHFAGKLAVFRGGATGVVAQTQNQLRRVRADQCEITLTNPIASPLRAKGSTRIQAEVDTIKLIGNVYVENHTIELQQRTSLITARLPDFEINQRTGAFFSNGPGWISNVGVSKSKSPFQLVSNKPEPNPTGLSYLRVDYQHRLQGNMQDRKATFEGNVEVIYGPVQTWGEVLDADNPAGLGPQGAWMACQQLDVNQSTDSPKDVPLWELQATDNVRVQSDGIVAEGDRVAYSQAKDRLLFEGSARRDAMITRRDPKTGSSQVYRSRQLFYSPKSQTIEGEFKELDFGRIPGKGLKKGIP